MTVLPCFSNTIPQDTRLVRPTPKKVPPQDFVYIITEHQATLKKLEDNKIENHELTHLLSILYKLYYASFQREAKEEFSIGDYFCLLIENLERLRYDDVDGLKNPNSMDCRIQAHDLTFLMSSNPIKKKSR